MAIPARPMGFRPMDLTLDDYIWLSEWMASERKDAGADVFKRLREMLPGCSDWTAEEVGRLKMSELSSALSQMTAQGGHAEAIPPSNGDALQPGQTA